MKTFALACTAAIAMGLSIEDAQSKPADADVSYFFSFPLFLLTKRSYYFSLSTAGLPTSSAACGLTT